jgi:PEP-CTERM motif
MRLWLKIFFAALLLCQSSHAQGFVDLNFESATNNTIPGWTAYLGSIAQTVVPYNGLSLGGANVSIIDTNNTGGLLPLRGKYSVLLQGSSFGAPTAASVGQTGQIPINTLSLLFFQSLTVYGLQVTFNGQAIPLFQTGATTNYAIMGGDISAFAGQTGQLLFSALPNLGNALLDNIQFSSSPIPEPSSLALVALGCGLFGFRHRRKVSKT